MRSPRWLPLALSVLFCLVAPAASQASSAPVWLPASSAAGASSSDLRLAHDAVGSTVAVWRKSSDGSDSVWTATMPVGSTTFGVAKRLSPAPGAGETPQISDLTLAVDAQGGAVAAWTGRYTTGAQPYVYLAQRHASAWGGAQIVSIEGPGTSPAVAFKSTGNAVLAWRQTTDGYAQLRVSAIDLPAGTLSAVQSVAPTTGDAGQPTIAFDGQGNGVLAWVESAVSFSAPYSGEVKLRAATRKASAATFTGAQLVYATRTSTLHDVKAAVDGAGNATLVWADRLLDTGAAAGVFAATRVVGATSWPGAPLSTTGVTPDVAASTTGGAVVTWVDPAAGAAPATGAVMAAHRAQAVTTFAAPMPLSGSGETGAEPVAAASASGATVVAWVRRQGAGDAPRAAVKAASSTTFWPAEDLDPAGGTLGAPAASVSLTGDALVLWQPQGSASTLQRMTRLDGSTVAPTPDPEPVDPGDPAPTTPTDPAPTTPTEPAPTTPTDPAPTTPTPSTPTPTEPSAVPTSPAPAPTTTTVVPRAPATSVAKDPSLVARETPQAAGAVSTDLALVEVPSLRSFKALAAKRFKPAAGGTGVVARGDGLPLAATANLPGTLRIVVTRAPKGGRAKNLKPALSVPIEEGTTSFVFTGRLAGKPLPAGLYKLKAVFVDARGRASNRRELTIAIKR
ncbi:MAG: hypothetical protein JHD16_09945 [Solirubrobacteraceae bacterium]|nr:hypothetical protein [Solirubrobacteraceae bacterium]